MIIFSASKQFLNLFTHLHSAYLFSVTIKPIDITKNHISNMETDELMLNQSSATAFQLNNSSADALGCNVDILPIFLGKFF